MPLIRSLYPALLVVGTVAIMGILLIAGCATRMTTEEIDKKYMNSASNRTQIGQLSVHFRDEGNKSPSSETVVLLHGTASSLLTWDAWTERLRDHYRILRMDLPGLGLTGPREDKAYEIPDDVAFLHQFLMDQQQTAVHLVGSSLGGRIAWAYALKYPDQVKSLTLINALGYPQASWPPAIEMAQWNGLDDLMALYIPRFVYQISLGDIYHDPDQITDQVVDRYHEIALREGNLEAFTDRVKADLDSDARKIPDISVPTLILWGEEDKYFPVENAFRFHRDIPYSKLETYPDVAHLPMEESPQASSDDFRAFVDSLR